MKEPFNGLTILAIVQLGTLREALFLERSIFRDRPIVSDRGNGAFFVKQYNSTVCVFRSNKVTKAQINVHGFQKICYTSLKCE